MTSTQKDLDMALAESSVSLFREMVAYEALWSAHSASLKSIAEKFARRDLLPSELLAETAGPIGLESMTKPVAEFLTGKHGYSVLLSACFQYPQRLKDARHPVELLYYRGDIGLLESHAVAVVGARNCSEEGKAIAARISRTLVKHHYTVSSGLAHGVDTAAMEAALDAGGRVIGVIGTPIDECYPKENRQLQDAIGRDNLLVSHVPFYRYHHEPFQARRFHFPIRNAVMAAVSDATVIVEASDRSGSLTQARACIEQNRLLFITENCLRNPLITWPAKYLAKGAIKVSRPIEIVENLKDRYGAPLD